MTARSDEVTVAGRPEQPRVTGAEVLVVVNPVATGTDPEAALQALDQALGAAGRSYQVFEVPRGAETRAATQREIRRALAEGCRRVIAVGGDGTVSLTGEALARAQGFEDGVPLGIVPAGTANVLAGELGITGSVETAAATVAGDAPSLALDAIEIGKRLCFTQVGIGPDAMMIRDTSRESQAKLGRMAYMATFLRRGFGQPSRRFQIDLDGATLRVRAWQIIVASAGNLGVPPFTWGPRIDPTDGVLDLCVLDARGPLDHARLLWRFLLGRHRKDRSTRYFRVRDEVVIRSDRPVLVQGDGEILGKTPVTLRVRARAVRVLVRKDVEAPIEEALASASTSGPGAAAPVAKEVETMLAAEHSRTWVLQGWLRHPVAVLQAFDAALFLRVNAMSSPLADRVASFISSTMRYGEGWALVLAAMIAIDLRTGLRTAVEAAPVIGLTMLTVNVPLKRLFRRRRPFIAFVKARVFGTRPRDFSFPSGHAAAGFAGALVLGAHAPLFAPLFYALAVVVSLSRVYLGVHYPSDIAFGGFLGVVIAAIYRSLLLAALPGLG